MNYTKTRNLAAATIITLSISAATASDKNLTHNSILEITKQEQKLNKAKRKYTKKLKSIGASKSVLKNIQEAKTVREVKILSDKYLDSYYIF